MDWTTIGHKKIKNYLENCLQRESLSHAYLFFGKKGLGKYNFARDFAKAVLCFSLTGDKENVPCGHCEACLSFDKKNHLDFIELNQEKDAQNISIKQIRELNKQVVSSSFLGTWQVIIIKGADHLSLAAANALLKTLEEPRKKTIFILLAENLSYLPQTIVSRTEKIKFLPVGKEEMKADLKLLGFPDLNMEDILSISQGKPEKATFFLKNEKSWPVYLKNVNLFLKIISSKKFEKIKIAGQLLENAKKVDIAEREYLLSIVIFWETLWRDLLLLKMSISDIILNNRVEKQLVMLAPYFEHQKIVEIIRELEILKESIKTNQNNKLVLENFLLKI
jgi:DNA polymerase III subunit delta'